MGLGTVAALIKAMTKKTEKTVAELKTDIDDKPEIKTTDAEDVDLDITDPNGYVLARFAGGNVQTKNFDSRAIPNVHPTTEMGSPFDIADGNGNVIMRLKNGHVETKFFDSSVIPAFNEYLFSGSDLLISFGYNNTHDAVVVFNVGRANDLFDFNAFKLKTKGKRLDKCGSSDFTTVWQSVTDMHSPFQINATQNADGYYASSTDAGYTGGNHLVNISGTDVKCASSEYVFYFADGKPVSSGYGCFVNFEIKWANNIQAYNCVKADGTGRTSLIEYHDMIFDGIRFNEEIMLVPQEEIKIELWHGLQSVGWNVVYNKARFIDATNREMFTPSDSEIKSGNNVTSGIIQEGNGHGLEMRVDITCDLGKRTFYTGTSGAFLTNDIHKGYFYIINNDPTGYTLDEDDAYYLRGSYRFYPVAE